MRAPSNATKKIIQLQSGNKVDNVLCRKLSNGNVEVASASVVRAPSNATKKIIHCRVATQWTMCSAGSSATTMLKLRALELCVLQATQQRR